MILISAIRGRVRNSWFFYVYLGILFNFNGNLSKRKKDLSDQGSKALLSLLSKYNSLNIPLDLQCEPVADLRFGEGWGSG